VTFPSKYSTRYLPTKYFLSSYRALIDAYRAIHLLEKHLDEEQFYLSDWKIHWIAACALLRTSIDLFRIDGKSCLAPELRREIANEWQVIGVDRVKHAVFWGFIKKERDSVIHQYEWGAYEAWLDNEGNYTTAVQSLLIMKPKGFRNVLLMRSGPFKGRDSVELLKEASDWVSVRIFSAIERAGFSPEEHRNLATFALKPPPATGLGVLLGELPPPE
jgi:hypothetical protein